MHDFSLMKDFAYAEIWKGIIAKVFSSSSFGQLFSSLLSITFISSCPWHDILWCDDVQLSSWTLLYIPLEEYLKESSFCPFKFMYSYNFLNIICKVRLVSPVFCFVFDFIFSLKITYAIWQVVFRLVMFQPFVGEILSGKIERSDATGLHGIYFILFFFSFNQVFCKLSCILDKLIVALGH